MSQPNGLQIQTTEKKTFPIVVVSSGNYNNNPGLETKNARIWIHCNCENATVPTQLCNAETVNSFRWILVSIKGKCPFCWNFSNQHSLQNERNHSVMYAVCRIQCELRLGRLRNYNVERRYQLRTIRFQQMKMRKYIPCVRVEWSSWFISGDLLYEFNI